MLELISAVPGHQAVPFRSVELGMRRIYNRPFCQPFQVLSAKNPSPYIEVHIRAAFSPSKPKKRNARSALLSILHSIPIESAVAFLQPIPCWMSLGLPKPLSVRSRAIQSRFRPFQLGRHCECCVWRGALWIFSVIPWLCMWEKKFTNQDTEISKNANCEFINDWFFHLLIPWRLACSS